MATQAQLQTQPLLRSVNLRLAGELLQMEPALLVNRWHN